MRLSGGRALGWWHHCAVTTLPTPGEPVHSIRAALRRILPWPLPAVLLGVMLAHLMLLQGMSFGEPAGRTPLPASTTVTAPVQVRQIELQAPAHAVVAAAAVVAAPAITPVTARVVPPVPRPAPTPAPAPALPLAAPSPAGFSLAPPLPVTTVDAVPDPERTPEAAPAASGPLPAAPEPGLLLAAAAPAPRGTVPPPPRAGDTDVPVYATRLPPPVLLRYELRRGAISGAGELAWQPADGRYRMAMEGTVLGINALGWVSQGRLDAHGIAPERFVDRRRGRDAQAANFQRDKGLITYSGPSVVHGLLPGAQDRLSFMLQLSAIVDAAPAKYGVGAQIALFVTGARGDADVWTFTVESVDTISVPAGRVPGALHLRREPRKPYDTRAELWLDPARSHLPVRVRLSSAEREETTDFLLREVATP